MPNIHPKERLVPAKYIGGHAVELGPGLIYYNIDGTRRRKRSLEHGDTLMMRDEDIFGKTVWHDPHHQLPSKSLGIGRCILPEHAGLSREELGLAGYEFSEGRGDFEPLEAPPKPIQEVIPATIEASQIVNEGDTEQIIETPEPEPAKEEEKPAETSTEDANATPAQQESEVI